MRLKNAKVFSHEKVVMAKINPFKLAMTPQLMQEIKASNDAHFFQREKRFPGITRCLVVTFLVVFLTVISFHFYTVPGKTARLPHIANALDRFSVDKGNISQISIGDKLKSVAKFQQNTLESRLKRTANGFSPSVDRTGERIFKSPDGMQKEMKTPTKIDFLFELVNLGLNEILWNVDLISGQQLMEKIMAEPFIIAAALLNETDQLVCAYRRLSETEILPLESLAELPNAYPRLTKEIRNKGKYLGKILLVYDETENIDFGFYADEPYEFLAEKITVQLQSSFWNYNKTLARSILSWLFKLDMSYQYMDNSIQAVVVLDEDSRVFTGFQRQLDQTLKKVDSVDELPYSTEYILKEIKHQDETIGYLVFLF